MIECYLISGKIKSREFLKFIMKKYWNTDITDEDISVTENGKPFFKNPLLPKFSISHTAGALMIAISDESEVGIDVESASRKVGDAITRSRFFSDEERASFKSSKDFLAYWTKKESAIKCIGGTIAKDFTETFFSGNRVIGNPYQGKSLFVSTFSNDSHIWSITSSDTKIGELVVSQMD